MKIALADPSYINDANRHNLYVPLNIGYLASTLRSRFGNDISIRVFKHPEKLLDYVREHRPSLVGLANYYWNDRLNYLLSGHIKKELGSETVIVAGGPSVDSNVETATAYLNRWPELDAVIPDEGEDGLSSVVQQMLSNKFEGGLDGVVTRDGAGKMIGLKTDLDKVPSPYLDGTLDEFLQPDQIFQPLVQTSRLCPYTCLAGDTLINTIIGNIPIRELAEKYGDAGIPVYTFDLNTREAFIAESIMIRKYGQGKQLVRVHFDDGTHIDCTPDHKFLQFSRSDQWICEAAKLPVGAQVRALRIEINPHNNRAYINWTRRGRQLRSRMVKAYEIGRKLTRSEHVHHLDHNTLNDASNNLTLCTSALEHMKLHPEIAERMRTNNPTKNGMSQEWRDKLTAAVRGKVRSLEARLRYRESKLGIKNPNFKDGSTGGRSRIPEVNHKVVSVEWLAEKGDVYCLTVPSTGWFYANNVLVKNCSFCVSGKNRGKLRAFPIEQVEAEIQYVSKHFQDRKDVLFYLVDENFGILARDREIAHMIVRERERSGYPNKIFYYNDKRFTQLSRDVHEIVGDMCHHGVMLSLQSENPETLKAIKRRNLTDEQIVSALGWAKSLDLKTSTELIFGLPMETRESFLALIDKCARIGFEAIQCYNLIIFDGIEMNRTTYRQAHELVTKRRLIHGNKGTVEGQFVVESEEVVVSSNSFDDDTYRLIRSFNVFFHAVYIFGLKRKEINEAIANGRPITDILIALTKNPVSEGHAAFLKDLNEAIDAELLNEDDVKAIIAGTKAEPPVVKIQPVFAGRLIEAANGWAGEAFDSVLYNRNDSLILAE